MPEVEVIHGDCLDVLPTLEAGSVDAVVTDPPYPCVKRSYGTWTEAEWFALMDPVVEQCRRVLKPTGSAVFVLQPNSERVGRMRTWFLEFVLKWAKAWGWVQDHYWWNIATLPGNYGGLNRPSVKACVWFGDPGCYRDQDAVLWTESDRNRAVRASARCDRTVSYPSGRTVNHKRMCGRAELKDGGVTSYNLLPISNTNSTDSAGSNGHGAGTPLALCRWWVRYICPPDGLILDPFLGSGTTAVACLKEGRRCVGIEREAEYVEIARRRVAEVEAATPLFRQLEIGG